MARNSFFTGLDIGTGSTKVLVAEFVSGGMDMIGVDNVPSMGAKGEIIINIEAAAETVRKTVEQAEEKAGMTIGKINVGLPVDLLQVEPTQGMIPIPSGSREIKDEDVGSVVKSALIKSIAPEREVISLIPREFIAGGFQGTRDPCGMMGIRLEMRGLIYTGPGTILHNLRKTIERAGISVENIIIAPFIVTKSALNESEHEFGTTVIDLGDGQTTVVSMRAQGLQYTNIYSESDEYVTKDISRVLKTSMQIAETLKFSFGQANLEEASLSKTVQVNVVGSDTPISASERYLSEIVSACIRYILDRIKQDLGHERLLDLPESIALVSDETIMPGVVEVAQKIFETTVKLRVPDQVGIHNPMFANVISFIEYVGIMSKMDAVAQRAVSGEELLRRKPVDFEPQPQVRPRVVYNNDPVVPTNDNLVPPTQVPPIQKQGESKPKLGECVRDIFGNMPD